MATDPVYVGSRDEIIALIGQPAYDVLADLCDKQEALLRANPTDAALAPHPPIPFPNAIPVPKSKPSFACSACGATALR